MFGYTNIIFTFEVSEANNPIKVMFTTSKNPNTGLSIYFNGLFIGLYSPVTKGIINLSGNKDSLFDVNLMVTFLQSQHPNDSIYSHESIAGNQLYLSVSIDKPITTEGVVLEYLPQ